MSERTADIVAAARAMFARYGYTKTTMGDIAREAGVARQTVYNAFPGKPEVLCAVVRTIGVETVAAVKAAWSVAADLEEKLIAYQDIGPVAWFEAIHRAPDWAELMEDLNQSASTEMDSMQDQIATMLIAELRKEQDVGDLPEAVLREIAVFFLSASKNAKYGLDEVGLLRARLKTIRAATLALLDAERSSARQQR